MASTSGTASVPTGCYKCGRPGHWSKDCNAAPAAALGESGQSGGSRSFSKPGEFRGGSFPSSYSSKKSATSGSGGFNESAPKKEVPKQPRTRPKLTADLLLSENGLGYVLEKMPDMVTIKGREDTVVRDLRSLLEGYMSWHSHLLPYFSFDQFIEKVEKIGSSKRVRKCTRDLRDKILYGDKGLTGKSDAGEAASSAFKDSSPENPSVEPVEPVEPERAEQAGGGSNDAAEEDRPAIPVSEEDFEDFFRQGVGEVETSKDTCRDGNASEKGIEIEQPIETSGGTTEAVPVVPGIDEQPIETSAGTREAVPVVPTPTISKSSTISEAAAARMEANRLQALERLKARKAREQLS